MNNMSSLPDGYDDGFPMPNQYVTGGTNVSQEGLPGIAFPMNGQLNEQPTLETLDDGVSAGQAQPVMNQGAFMPANWIFVKDPVSQEEYIGATFPQQVLPLMPFQFQQPSEFPEKLQFQQFLFTTNPVSTNLKTTQQLTSLF